MSGHRPREEPAVAADDVVGRADDPQRKTRRPRHGAVERDDAQPLAPGTEHGLQRGRRLLRTHSEYLEQPVDGGGVTSEVGSVHSQSSTTPRNVLGRSTPASGATEALWVMNGS